MVKTKKFIAHTFYIGLWKQTENLLDVLIFKNEDNYS